MCTGIYIGKKVSSEGRRVIARTEDQTDCVYPKVFLSEPAVSEPGRFMRDDWQEGRSL